MVCFIGAFPQEIRFKKSKYRRALKYYLGHLYRKKKTSDVTGFHFHFVKDNVISEKIIPIRKNIYNHYFTSKTAQISYLNNKCSELYDYKTIQKNNKK